MKRITFEVEGKKLVGFLHRPENKNNSGVVMIHGFKGDKNEYGRFEKSAEVFCKDGFTVLRFDCRGTRDSDGEFRDMTIQSEVKDLVAAIDVMKKENVENVGIMGISLGGEIALLSSLQRDVKALVLWAPVTTSEKWKTTFSEEQMNDLKTKGETIIYGKKSGEPWTIGKELLDSFMNTKVEDELSKIKAATLILHGTKDVNVSLEDSKKAIEKLNEPKELKIIEGEDHYFLEQLDDMIEISLNWFRKYL